MPIYDDEDINSADWFVLVLKPFLVGIVCFGLYIIARWLFDIDSEWDLILRCIALASPALTFAHYAIGANYNNTIRNYARAKLALIPFILLAGWIAVSGFGLPNPLAIAASAVEGEITAAPTLPTEEEQREVVKQIIADMPPTKQAENLGYRSYVTVEGKTVRGHLLWVGESRAEMILEDGARQSFNIDHFNGRHREFILDVKKRYRPPIEEMEEE